MNTLLTAPDIEYLLTQQEKLDTDIREKKGISLDEWYSMYVEHRLALKVEVAEFVNECHDQFKYWKSKQINRARIIDEAVDVIHFLMLIYNKMGITPKGLYNHLTNLTKNNISSSSSPKSLLNLMMGSGNSDTIFYSLLIVLDHYSFTSKDIIDAYNKKNAENFLRLENGY